jgi:hypothetical protein
MTDEKIRRLSTMIRQNTFKPEDFSLQAIIGILKLTIAQRSMRQNYILQQFTKNIKFFINLIEENGDFVHTAACERLTYEFVPAGQVFFK